MLDAELEKARLRLLNIVARWCMLHMNLRLECSGCAVVSQAGRGQGMTGDMRELWSETAAVVTVSSVILF